MTIEVFFGTNRKVTKYNQDQQPCEFGTKLNTEKPLLHFGKAKVSDDMKCLEEINTSRSTSSKVLCCSQDIFNEIQGHMYKGIDIIIFFHGFNNTFKESIMEATELKSLYETESKRKYTMIVLSWPSDGSLFAYINDRKDACKSGKILGASLYQMSQFLIKLCIFKDRNKASSDTNERNAIEKQNNRIRCGRVHIIAHSMGNYILRHVLQEICKINGGNISQTLFDEIISVAADIDEDSFEHKNKFQFLPKIAKRISVYFNIEDFALKISA